MLPLVAFMDNLYGGNARQLLNCTVGSMAVRTGSRLFALFNNPLKVRRSSQNVRARIAHPSEHGISIMIAKQDATAGFADALQNVERMLDETNVKNRQREADVAVVSGTVG